MKEMLSDEVLEQAAGGARFSVFVGDFYKVTWHRATSLYSGTFIGMLTAMDTSTVPASYSFQVSRVTEGNNPPAQLKEHEIDSIARFGRG